MTVGPHIDAVPSTWQRAKDTVESVPIPTIVDCLLDLMRNIDEIPAATRKNIRWLLTDIDDTVTTDGKLPAASLAAMEHAKSAGIHVLAVTGRPAGWCDHIARMWPVDAVVGENGALWFAYDHDAKVMRSDFAKTEVERRTDRLSLDRIRDAVLEQVPGSGIASDQSYRIADLAIDFCEDVTPLDASAVRRIVEIFEDAGATAKVSSIHVNGWFGTYDKLTMTRRCFEALYEQTLESAANAVVYAGDSPNDEPMFRAFPNSVGVANVRDFELTYPPSWVTTHRSAEGFSELVNLLVAGRA